MKAVVIRKESRHRQGLRKSYLSLTRKILARAICQDLGRIYQILIYTIPPKSTLTSAIAFEIKFKLMVVTSCSVLMAIMESLNPYLKTWLSSQSTQSSQNHLNGGQQLTQIRPISV
jgi:hypothetical protein